MRRTCRACGSTPCSCPGLPKASQKHKDAMKYIYDLSEVSMCCISPPSADGSMCCGGTCACEEDYKCERCKCN
jgi:hypothetical protein